MHNLYTHAPHALMKGIETYQCQHRDCDSYSHAPHALMKGIET